MEMARLVPGTAEPGGDVVLRLRDIRKSYGSLKAVNGVSIDVKRGEILTLLGPSGCGKTTTLRIIVGLDRATAGTVSFQGDMVDDAGSGIFVPPNRRNMGMVFQSYAIWPHMSVFENVAYPLRVRRVRGQRVAEEVKRVLKLVGLEGFEQRAATKLSGGQMQRVAVARALIFDPAILLMDEPFSNLDAKLRDQMRTEIKILQRRLGITVLFVTHDQIEALALSDRIVVMNQGRMEQIGLPQTLYADPHTPAVRDFLGQTIKLHGRLVERSGGSQRVALRDGRQIVVAGGERGGRLEIGAPCVVTIRPEFIEILRTDAAGAPDGGDMNLISARLDALLFLGDRYEASAATAVAEEILIFLSAAETWAEGQSVTLSLPAERLQLWSA